MRGLYSVPLSSRPPPVTWAYVVNPVRQTVFLSVSTQETLRVQHLKRADTNKLTGCLINDCAVGLGKLDFFLLHQYMFI